MVQFVSKPFVCSMSKFMYNYLGNNASFALLNDGIMVV